MQTLSTFLVFCEGNPQVNDGFPGKGPALVSDLLLYSNPPPTVPLGTPWRMCDVTMMRNWILYHSYCSSTRNFRSRLINFYNFIHITWFPESDLVHQDPSCPCNLVVFSPLVQFNEELMDFHTAYSREISTSSMEHIHIGICYEYFTCVWSSHGQNMYFFIMQYHL